MVESRFELYFNHFCDLKSTEKRFSSHHFWCVLLRKGGKRSCTSIKQCSVEGLLIYVSKITWNGEGLKTLSCSISGIVVMLELPACLVTNDLVPSYFALFITSIIIHCMYRCRYKYIINNQVLK